MNAFDYAVLFSTMLGIAAFGIWRTRGRRDLSTYLKGKGNTRWFVIGLSVMATQASAITFLSTPGQGYQDGLGFVQNYFGMPLALIVICIFFLPIYRKLNVYTAYEFLGRRFDSKTRLLGVALFLLQRGLGAGITIYAPAIVLSAVFGWPLDLTILCSGIVVIVYTVSGGSDAVTLTQKYQIGVIFLGMFAAFFLLIRKLPAGLSFSDALVVAGGMHRLKAVDFSTSLKPRYTFWSGTIGGFFLAMSYFGCDQSQVQRYIGGASLHESRLGLMFNAVFKIPMQLFILLLGVMLFVFYQFAQPPIVFNESAWKGQVDPRVQTLQAQYDDNHQRKQQAIEAWLNARREDKAAMETDAYNQVQDLSARGDQLHDQARKVLYPNGARTNEADYVFITFILSQLPHGLIGLLVAAFFAAALSSKSAELNSLASATTVDLYRHLIRREATDAHYVAASRWFTVFWGCVALSVALLASLAENLIQATNILGSVLYGVPLAIFLAGFFIRAIGGTAIFVAAIVSQIAVLAMYYELSISYLWYNLIGCVVCLLLGAMIQLLLPRSAGAK
ncbi:MAG TPA: sodium:solute symporter [Tepidisphaeraceae bacterium]|nr:sodium:solute symporter [Tepidisphaeraceae bacterium]